MIFCSTITTSSVTPRSDPLRTVMQVTAGLVYLIEVEYPAGCCGLTGVRLLDGNYQLFPATPEEWLRGDGVVARYDELYMLSAAPYELIIETYNDDEVYDHTIQVRLGMATTKAEMSRYMPLLSFEDFETRLAELLAEQEEAKGERLKSMLTELGGG